MPAFATVGSQDKKEILHRKDPWRKLSATRVDRDLSSGKVPLWIRSSGQTLLSWRITALQSDSARIQSSHRCSCTLQGPEVASSLFPIYEAMVAPNLVVNCYGRNPPRTDTSSTQAIHCIHGWLSKLWSLIGSLV